MINGKKFRYYDDKTKVFTQDHRTVYVRQRLAAEDGKLVLNTWYNREATELLEPHTVALSTVREGDIEALRRNLDQLKVDLRAIRNTVGGYLSTRTGEKISAESNAKKPELFYALVQCVIEEYMKDYFAALDVAMQQDTMKQLQELHPALDQSHVLSHIRNVIYEDRLDEKYRIALKFGPLEEKIILLDEKVAQQLLGLKRQLEKRWEVMGQFPSLEASDAHKSQVEHYKKLGRALSDILDAYNEAWSMAMQAMRRSGSIDAIADDLKVRRNAIVKAVEQAMDCYREFQGMSGLRARVSKPKTGEQPVADAFDDIELLLDQAREDADLFAQPRILTAMLARGLKATGINNNQQRGR